MSGALFFLIKGSQTLKDLGVQSVYSDFSGEVVRRDSLTVILRWGAQNYQRSVRTGPRELDVWVHQPMEFGSDYTNINKCLAEINTLLESMIQEVGPDNVIVTEVDKVGASGNIHDPGFNTLTRYTSYRVLLREMV